MKKPITTSISLQVAACVATLLGVSTAAYGDVTLGAGASASTGATSPYVGNVSFAGNNATFTIQDGVVLNGNVVVNTGVTGSALNFAGGGQVASSGAIGSSASELANVTYNSAGNGVADVINQSVWALNTTLGNGIGNSTTATINASAVSFGGNLSFANPYTTLVVGSSRNVVQGLLNTNGGTLDFTLTPLATATTPNYSSSNFQIFNGAGSGQITAGSLSMSGGETINLNYTGSLRDGATYTLIGNANNNLYGSYNQQEASTRITDNSYVLNSAVATDGSGNLVLTVSRANDEYITKSATQGDLSNGAALALGTIAAQGKQLGDMVTAINTLDLNNYGYGNSQQNLAVQVRRLAPIANNSALVSALSASDLLLSQVDDRLLARDQAQQGRSLVWVRPVSQVLNQSGTDNFDGYRTLTNGLALGADTSVGRLRYGFSLGFADSGIDQQNFRQGDRATLHNYLGSVYGQWVSGATFANMRLAVGSSQFSGNRATAIGRTASYQFNDNYADASATLGYRFRLLDGKSAITPVIGLESTWLRQPDYTETGAGDLGLHVNGVSYNRLRSKIGAYFSNVSGLGRYKLQTTLYAMSLHDGGLNNTNIQANYTGSTNTAFASLTEFQTPGATVQSQVVQVGADFTLLSGQHAGLQFGYQLSHQLGLNMHSLHLLGSWKF